LFNSQHTLAQEKPNTLSNNSGTSGQTLTRCARVVW